MAGMLALYDVARRFENAVRLKTELPLICYALDERILPSAVYEKYRNKNVSALVRERRLFYGVLLLWVRNFYEKSNGGDCWSLTNGFDDPPVKDEFQRRCRSVNVLKNAIPRFKQEARPWLTLIRSQCWLIKSNSSLSDILRFNQRMYRLLSPCGFFSSAVAWNDIEESTLNIDDGTKEDIEDFVAFKPYLKYIWDNYPVQYICSLKAIVSSPMADRDENAPSWIRPLIGLAGDSINSYYTWKLLKRSDNSLSPALILSGNLKKAQISQGNIRVHINGSGIYHLWYLIQQGIDVKQSFHIKVGVYEEQVALPLFRDYVIFSARGDKEVIENGDKISGGAFFLFGLVESDLNVILRDGSGDVTYMNGESVGCVAPGLQCLRYRIPYIPQSRIKRIIINGEDTNIQVDTKPRIVLCNPCDVSVVDEPRVAVVDSREIRFYAYGMHNVRIGERCIHEVESGTCYYQETIDTGYGEVVIRGTSNEGNVNSRLRLVVLPSDWKHHCEHDDLNTVISKARAGKHLVRYTSPDGAVYQLEFPLERPVIFWMRGNEVLECLNEEQYLEGGYNLNIIRPDEAEVDAKLIIGAREYMFHVADSLDFLTSVFRENVDRVKIGEEIIVTIGNHEVYRGGFRPNFCYINDGRIYCPQFMRSEARLLCRGNSYYTIGTPLFRQYLKVIELDSPELLWDENGGLDISEWYNLYPNELIIQFLYEEGESLILIKEIVRDALPVNFNIEVSHNQVRKRISRCQCDWETSSLPAFLHAFRNNYRLYMDASDIYDEWGQQNARDIMFHRLCNSYVGINLDNEINQPWYENEEKEDEWWNCWSLRLNTLKDKMLTWSADAHPEYVLSSGELETLGDKIFSKLDIEKVDRFLILWNNMKTVASVSRLFVLAAAISLGKGKVNLNVKEAVFLSYSKWFYSQKFPSALKKMCAFMELVKESPFRGILQQIEFLFEPVRNIYIAIPGKNWLLMVNRLVHTFMLSPLWPRLAEELHRNHNMNRNNVMIAAIFYHLWMHLVHKNQNDPRLREFIRNHNVMVGMINLKNVFGNNGIYSDRFSNLNKFFNQQITQF